MLEILFIHTRSFLEQLDIWLSDCGRFFNSTILRSDEKTKSELFSEFNPNFDDSKAKS